MTNTVGKIVLMGSGETAPTMQPIYAQVFAETDAPVRMAIVETPAGFQPNSAAVAGQVAAYIKHRLQNFRPEVWQAPARRRSHPYSTNDPEIAKSLLAANVIFMGPGSPTYAARCLRESRVWQTIQARHRLGATLIFASAGVLALGVYTLPVYEIYKVGEDLHWQPGLDLLGAFGLSVVFVSHWNNNDGGAELDTSRCFMGQERFERLLALLPLHPRPTVVGIDEKTALNIDLQRQVCRVAGLGGVVVLQEGATTTFPARTNFPLALLGDLHFPHVEQGLPSSLWEEVCRAVAAAQQRGQPAPPAAVLALAEEREHARRAKEWVRADHLRSEIALLGWSVRDTPDGFLLDKSPLIGQP